MEFESRYDDIYLILRTGAPRNRVFWLIAHALHQANGYPLEFAPEPGPNRHSTHVPHVIALRSASQRVPVNFRGELRITHDLRGAVIILDGLYKKDRGVGVWEKSAVERALRDMM